jgi:hypothetical protein
MRLSRRSRFATALFALLTVLCMQLAVAAYACPSLQPVFWTATAAEPAPAAGHEGMAGCEGMVDIEQPALCYVHSQVGNQSLDKPAAPDVPPSIAIMLVPAIPDAVKPYFPLSRYADAAWRMHDSAPSLAIRNCCFRI